MDKNPAHDAWLGWQRKRKGWTELDPAEKARLATLLRSTPGPIGWYEVNPSPLPQGFIWQKSKEPGVPVLFSEMQKAVALIAGLYAVPIACKDGFIGFVQGRDQGVRVEIYELSELRQLERESTTPPGVDRLAATSTDPSYLTDFPIWSGEFEAPLCQFISNVEILILSDLLPVASGTGTCMIVRWFPRAGRANGYRQHWFNGENFDLGYQWITKVATDPVTGLIVGAGMRLPQFELDESNSSVRRWFWVFD